MDDVTICDVRARGIRIWQINSQNFRVRKIWKTWFLDLGTFSWQNATYTIQFILTIYIYSEKLMLPGRCAPVELFSWKCGKLRKTAKSGYPALIWPFRTSLFSTLSWNKISHMKLQSKMFKTAKDMYMFYKQFEFFGELTGPIMGLYESCPLCRMFEPADYSEFHVASSVILSVSSPEPKAYSIARHRLSVRQHFPTTSPLKPRSRFLPYFKYSIYRQRGQIRLCFVPIV